MISYSSGLTKVMLNYLALLLGFVTLVGGFLVLSQVNAYAETENTVEAQITNLYNAPCPSDSSQSCVTSDVSIKSEIYKGVVLREGTVNDNSYEAYKTGDFVYLTKSEFNGQTTYVFARPKRTSPLVFLVIAFVVIILVVGGIKGWRSLVSLVVSTLAIFAVMLPLFVKYPDYVLIIGVFIAFVIYCLNQLIGHGVNKQSFISILGAAIAFVIVLVTSLITARLFLISGFGNEGSLFISQLLPSNFRLGDLFIVGTVLGLAGAVDDVNSTQASSIDELVSINPDIEPAILYKKGMRIGTSHMVSIINTLFLAYIGAALPTMILFSILNEPYIDILGREDVIEEVLRTIVASIGLLISIPLTTWLSVIFFSNAQKYSLRKRMIPFSKTK